MMEEEYFIDTATSEIKQLRTNYIDVRDEKPVLTKQWCVKVKFNCSNRLKIVKKNTLINCSKI